MPKYGRSRSAAGLFIVAATLAATVVARPAVAGKFKCDLPDKCTNPQVVDEVRAAVDAACDCATAASRKEYKRCWKPVVKSFVRELGKTGFPKPCQKVVKAALGNSVCGRTGFVLCRKVKKSGAELCQVKKETKCKDVIDVSSACGAFATCAEGCAPETCATTTTTSSSTTTTTLAASVLVFTTGPSAGTCGESRAGGAAGTVLKSLTCGGLNIGGGSSTVPEGPTPENAPTQFAIDCATSPCTVGARTAADTGSNTNCSDTGCNFGPPLSIANGGLSTCVLNTFASPGSGTLDLTSGAFDGSVPLTSTVHVTGNETAPCPNCVAGTCEAAAANAGAPCTAINAAGDSYECLPGGSPLTPFGVDLTPIGTGTATKTGPTFCPGQDATAPGLNGCFADPTCDYIEERGSAASGITPGGGPVAATLASVFCIPATGNFLIDGAADLPGPGATTLPGTLEIP